MAKKNENQEPKAKKHLILTSSGGGGHTAAAESIKAELLAKGVPQDQIEIVDLMGLYEKGQNKGDPWIPTISTPGISIAGKELISSKDLFSGTANTKTWNDLQAKGGEHAPQKLESLTDKQWMAEKIQNDTVEKRLKEYLEKNNVQGVYNTQALSAAPICKAVSEYNDKTGAAKRIKITGVVTEFLSDYATHFTNSLRNIPKQYRGDLVMRSITPPLRDPGESREAYTIRHGLQGIEFRYASEQAAPSPVNPLYSEGNYSQTGELVIKASSGAASEQDGKTVTNEQSFVKAQLGQGVTEVQGKPGHFSMKIDKRKDVVNFLTLGSQGSEAMFDYIDKFLEQAVNNPQHDGKVFLFITTSKNESTEAQKCMYHKALDHLNKRLEEYELAGKPVPENAKVVPLAFQDQENMASLMQNANNLIVRTGGMTAMQSKESRKNDTRQVTVHCEVAVPSIESFPVDNPDARREMFQKGLVKWEKGNADKLILEANGSLGGPQTINFGFAEAGAIAPKSLFKAAYDTYIEVPDEDGKPVMRPRTPQESLGLVTLTANSAEEIKKLIYQGSNPNLEFPASSHLIDHCADFETMKLLVEHGAKLTEKSKQKDFLQPEKLSALKAAEKQFKIDFKAGRSAIHTAFEEAVRTGNDKDVKGLMYNFDSIKNHKIEIDGQSLTPVQIAIKNKQTPILKTLLGKGARIDTQTEIGGLLHYAIEQKNLGAVQVLLEKGVNPHTKYHGKSAYDLLEKEQDKKFAAEALKLFIKEKVLDPEKYQTKIPGMSSNVLKDVMFEKDNKYKNSDIHRAVYYRNNKQSDKAREAFPEQTFNSILEKNPDKINELNEHGQTPIALCTNQELRRELVRYGADPKYAVGVNEAERKELMGIYKEYKDLTDNTLTVLSKTFKKSTSKEEFTAAIMEKFETMYRAEGGTGEAKLSSQREAIKEKCGETFDRLQSAKDEAAQKPIYKRFYQKLCSISGKSTLEKAFKEEAHTMQTSLQEIQSALRKYKAQPAQNADAPHAPAAGGKKAAAHQGGGIA